MRYNRHRRLVSGQIRTIKKFLWLPKTLPVGLTVYRETRWLERVKIVQKKEAERIDSTDFVWVDEFFVKDEL